MLSLAKQILDLDPDPDPHQLEKWDPDLDPHQNILDPPHCFQCMVFTHLEGLPTAGGPNMTRVLNLTEGFKTDVFIPMQD